MTGIKEIVVISGKGGTGKTSLVASFAVLAAPVVVVDCDVDAADLHLVLSPEINERHDFVSGHQAVIRAADCTGCGRCMEVCRFGAVIAGGSGGANQANGAVAYAVDPMACEGCGVCVQWCPPQAIDFPESNCGEWFISDTRCGPLVHARLRPAAENSGRLVSVVREAARGIAVEQGRPLVLIDGPPGIGCPVIASITGASAVLVVTEPTLSGSHDLARVLELTRHFGIPAGVCVNKWDINPEQSGRIEAQAVESGAHPVGRLPYDRSFTAAQIAGRSVLEFSGGGLADQIESIWDAVCHLN